MFSFKTLASGGAAASDIVAYCQHVAIVEAEGDETKPLIGYYQKSGDRGADQAPSRWVGNGAKNLGLTGEVDGDRLVTLLEGHISSGIDLKTRLSRKQPTSESDAKQFKIVKHRMGWDINLSAPKSVSIAYAAADEEGQREIRDAVMEAATDAFNMVEDRMVQARYKKGGVRRKNTRNMIAALHLHEDARPVDSIAAPLLHVHGIIINATKNYGVWRRIELDFGKENKKQKLVNLQFMSSLSTRLERLGLQSYSTEHGFELEGITRKQIEEFSPRRRQITEALREKLGVEIGESTAAQRQSANLATRESKLQIVRGLQLAAWREWTKAAGISVLTTFRNGHVLLTLKSRLLKTLTVADRDGSLAPADVTQAGEGVQGTVAPGEAATGRVADRDGSLAPADVTQAGEGVRRAITEDEELKAAIKAVQAAVNHLSERQAVFSDEDLHQFSLSFSMTRKINALPKYIDLAIEKRAAGLVLASGGWTTETQIENEINLKIVSESGLASVNPILTTDEVNELLKHNDGSSYTDGQKEAISKALTTDSRHFLIRGAAGVGKTTLLKPVVEEYKKAGFRVVGIAPTRTSLNEMKNAGCDKLLTAQAFSLYGDTDSSGEIISEPTVFLADEGGMLSTQGLFDILKLVNSNKESRSIIIGDHKQVPGVEAGSAFWQLLDDTVIPSVDVNEVRRQTDPELLDIAQKWAKQDAVGAVNAMVKFAKESNSPIADCVNEWKSMSLQERQNTLIISTKNETREKINEAIRDVLKDELAIADRDYTIGIMKTLGDETQERKSHFSNYIFGKERGQKYVRFVSDMEKLWIVDSVNEKKGAVNLKLVGGNEVKEWRPSKRKTEKVITYYRDVIELAVGDKVRYRENDFNGRFKNGTRGTVTEINEENYVVTTDSGKEIVTDKIIPVVLEYGYSTTVHSAQSQTCTSVLMVGDIGRWEEIASLAYVAATRAREKLIIFSKNLPLFLSRASQWAELHVVTSKESTNIELEAATTRIRSKIDNNGSALQKINNENVANNAIKEYQKEKRAAIRM